MRDFDIINISGLNKCIVCGYFTPDYADLADTLAGSLNKLGTPHHIFATAKVPGGWEANTMIKPDMIMKAIECYPGKTVIFVDADAEVQRDPSPLAEIKGDIAATVITKKKAKRNPKMFIRTGTLVIRPTPPAHAFISDWRDEAQKGTRWDIDQTTFAVVLARSFELSFQPLDHIWCARKGETASEPAILHGSAGKATSPMRRLIEQYLL